MSLDKGVKYGKEKRKPYRGAKAVDSSCRNHGSDDYARGNRLYTSTKRELAARYGDYEWNDAGAWMDEMAYTEAADDGEDT